ncbi:tetraspanin-2-like isoform X1 [Phycodurus eques]|uniref:tetraspanin-2-like isoform X1 n=1 Tax=Phycodurus eques TaxID=693459 RepID=UPI002ACEC468|nr:tetraspanin-2-like isoform X1 [Phycodurus eques]
MGKVEGGMKCVKYLLFLFNFIFWLMGSFVLAVGLWLRFDPETVSLLNGDKAPDTYFIGVYILIGAGSLVMLVGFFGCCGAVRESQCLLASVSPNVTSEIQSIRTKISFLFCFFGGFFVSLNLLQFFACLLIIFGAEVAAGVFGFLNKDKIIEDVQNFYATTYNENNNSTLIISYQRVLNCCGTLANNCSYQEPGTKDCETGVKDFFNSKLFIIGYVGIGIAGVMIIGMIFSMVLCCAVRNSREVI